MGKKLSILFTVILAVLIYPAAAALAYGQFAYNSATDNYILQYETTDALTGDSIVKVSWQYWKTENDRQTNHDSPAKSGAFNSSDGFAQYFCDGSYELQFYNQDGVKVGGTQAYGVNDMVSTTKCSDHIIVVPNEIPIPGFENPPDDPPPDDGNPGPVENFPEIQDAKATVTDSSIKVQWTNPTDSTFDHVNVYLDGEKVGETADNSYTISDLQAGSNHNIKMTTVDTSGNESAGVTKNVSTSSSNACDGACQVFKCPEWDEYMGKVDDVIAAIPPPPDWDAMTDAFNQNVVPKIISDMGDLLGSAPEPPTLEEPTERVDTGNIEQDKPDFNPPPDLGDQDFSEDHIKDQAPVIQEEPDTSGGFKIKDPVDSLPDLPEGTNPKPGMDAGAYKNDPTKNSAPELPQQPKKNEEIPTPDKPANDPTAPSTGPTPSESTTTAPQPSGGDYSPPSPDSGSSAPGAGYYKSSPDAPDGSGG